jgi:hypothetical protein
MGKVVHEIKHHATPSYDVEYGATEDGKYFQFFCNFNDGELPRYKQAIESYTGPGEFAIGDVAYGFNEDEGTSWLCHGMKAFYAKDFGENMDQWWRHLTELVVE